MKGLTDKQRRVFEFIRSQIITKNRPPTIREIGIEFNMSSTGSVRDVIRSLARKGFIHRDENISRGIRIKAGPGPLSGEIVELPVIGKISAGSPITAYKNIEETIKVDKSMLPEGDIFVVKVKGKSMMEAGINDGDYAFIRRQPTCRPGQIVAVIIDDEVTLKEFSRKGDEIHLLPKNKNFDPIIIDLKRFKTLILGVLVSVYRIF